MLEYNIHYLLMSFHSSRVVREARRGSPVIFQSAQLKPKPQFRSYQFSFNLKPTKMMSPEKNRIRDTFNNMNLSPKKSTRKSIGLPPASKERDRNKQILIGNYMNSNLDCFKIPRPINDQSLGLRLTERRNFNKSSKQQQYMQQPIITLKKFRLDFVVGKGGFGKVWKVYQNPKKTIYAMKQMQKIKIISKRSVHSVMNERNLLTKLSHHFLVNMVYAFQDREYLYLVMDYCNRGDLRYHLGTNGCFNQEVTRFFLACIILALEYMHSLKVMHRDLKPQNLVLDDKGYVKLTDLGVSRQVRDQNAEDTSGTPGYMAPQVICKMNHNQSVDFFALGVIAFEFMTGKRPYIGANRKQIRQKMLAKQVQLHQIPPFGWSRDSIDFINRLIQRKPQNRLGFNGFAQVKFHPFFKSVDWDKLYHRQYVSPFLPPSIEEDYSNYKECISEDTIINDSEQYQLLLRHKDTQQAFFGYDYNLKTYASVITEHKYFKNEREASPTLSSRKRK